MFGMNEISLGNDCSSASSEGNFPWSFKVSGKWDNNPVTWLEFTGNWKDRKFRTVEYEVYRLSWEEEL